VTVASAVSPVVRALWYVRAGECALNRAELPERQGHEALVRMLWSGISRGTERLIFNGRVPPSEHERMRCPGQEGDFPHPVKYGYCAVGVVESGPDHLVGRSVFTLHPHQERFVVPAASLTILPDDVPARRATLAANMETALNAHWDAGSGPGDRIVVVGGGVLGLLVAYLAAQLPGAEVTLVDVDPSRAVLARSFGCRFASPENAPIDADIVFHASASAAGLKTAIAAAGFEARIIELSWYGEGEVAAPLGGAFHSRRLQLISSQVGHVSASRRARWDYGRRLKTALGLLADNRLDTLITDEIAFGDAPARLPALFAPGSTGLTAVLRYGDNQAAARGPVERSATRVGRRPNLVPELVVTDIKASLAVWLDLFGFRILYERPESSFAYLERDGVEIMLEQSGTGPVERLGIWDTGPLQKPFGRGINFEITVADLDVLLRSLEQAGYPLFFGPEERWYRDGGTDIGVRQFLVTDPDGYLLRFSQSLGTRPHQA
jgi:threonine dehydrogenase-like Zn-dependent dehydrogenase/catechol 2,3-dioxygenase-like lactoylglutathione lyase family enzyme